VNESVHVAVIDLLVSIGYTNLTMDAVAVRAGVHRATLYRRWPNKAALVAGTLLQLTEEVIPIPDTGSVDEDLQLLIASVLRNLEGAGAGIIRAFVGEAARVPEVERAGQALWEYRLGLAAAVVRRGIARSELPEDINPDAFVEEMVAPIFFRSLITGKPVGADFARARVRRQLDLARRLPGTGPNH
jgi:AcrR family transcriptional regulator